MGEMTDMLIEQMWDLSDEDHMDAEEWWGTVGRWNKICRCCGRSNLTWELKNEKWRLCDERGIHVCPVTPLMERAA